MKIVLVDQGRNIRNVMENNLVSFDDFLKLDIRNGRVLSVEDFPKGKYSTHILKIDFGEELGEKKSLAKLAPNYQGEELIGKQVLAVVNFPEKQIGHHLSQVLVLGVPDEDGNVVLVHPDREPPLGGQLH